MQSFFDAVGSLRTAMNQASQLAEMLDREIESQEALLSKLQTERAAILEDFQDIKATAGHAKAIATESVELQNSLHSAVRLANGNLLDFARSMWAQVSASMETHLADVRRIQDQTETIALRVGGALANMTVMEDRMSGIGSVSFGKCQPNRRNLLTIRIEHGSPRDASRRLGRETRHGDHDGRLV